MASTTPKKQEPAPDGPSEEASPDKFALPPVMHQSARKQDGSTAANQQKVWKPTPTHAAAAASSSQPKASPPVLPFESMAIPRKVGPKTSVGSSFSPYEGNKSQQPPPALKTPDASTTATAEGASSTSKAAPTESTKPASCSTVDGADPTQETTFDSKLADTKEPPKSATAATTDGGADSKSKSEASQEPPKAAAFTKEPPKQTTSAAAGGVAAAKSTTPTKSPPPQQISPSSKPSKREHKKRVAAKSVLTGKMTVGEARQERPDNKAEAKEPPKKKRKKHKVLAATKTTLTKPVKRLPKPAESTPKVPAKKPKSTATKSKSPPSSVKNKKSPARPKAVEVEVISPPSENIGQVWPPGWKRRTFERKSGATKGTTDKYWYSPLTEKKLRSIKEVKRFLEFLTQHDGKEELAWKAFKGKL